MSNDQSDLFPDYTRARPSDPDTSHEAAAEVQRRLNALQQAVLAYFRAVAPHPMTDLDLENHFGNHRSTYRTRRAELTELGLLYDTGRRCFQAGSNRVLWAARRG